MRNHVRSRLNPIETVCGRSLYAGQSFSVRRADDERRRAKVTGRPAAYPRALLDRAVTCATCRSVLGWGSLPRAPRVLAVPWAERVAAYCAVTAKVLG